MLFFARLGLWGHVWDADRTCGLSDVLLGLQSVQLEARTPGLHASSSNDIFVPLEVSYSSHTPSSWGSLTGNNAVMEDVIHANIV